MTEPVQPPEAKPVDTDLVLVEAVGSGRIRVHGSSAPRPALLRWLHRHRPQTLITRNT